MKFNANAYMMAAKEHIAVALELHDSERYVLAHYAAGLAVECLFRAYRYRIDPIFDARHDLRELYRASQFARCVPEDQQRDIAAALSEVCLRWNNDFRFRSETMLRSYLKNVGADRGIKGNFLKENSRRLLRAATLFVHVGVKQWDRSWKS